MSDDFADRMRDFGDKVGYSNRAERRKAGLTKSKARKMGYLAPPEPKAPTKQVRIQKPKPKGKPNGQ